MKTRTWVRRLMLIGLLLLGSAEILFGLLLRPVEIREGGLARFLYVMNSSSTNNVEWTRDQSNALIGFFKNIADQWHIVAVFGGLTIVLSLIWYFTETEKPT